MTALLRDFYAESPEHDMTGRGWYLGGDMLSARRREYQLGGGFHVGPIAANAGVCTCGEWHFTVYVYLPRRRRVFLDLMCGERPNVGVQSMRPKPAGPRVLALLDRDPTT